MADVKLIDVDLDWARGELEARLDPKVVDLIHALLSDVKTVLGALYEKTEDQGDTQESVNEAPKTANARKTASASKKDPE